MQEPVYGVIREVERVVASPYTATLSVRLQNKIILATIDTDDYTRNLKA
jgi:hypothetical protein